MRLKKGGKKKKKSHPKEIVARGKKKKGAKSVAARFFSALRFKMTERRKKEGKKGEKKNFNVTFKVFKESPGNATFKWDAGKSVQPVIISLLCVGNVFFVGFFLPATCWRSSRKFLTLPI